MDNYLIAEQGVRKATEILEIDTPVVGVFTSSEAAERNINSLFLKEEYTILFSESWLDSANPIEVLITCFHETRHAFQWRVVCDHYFGSEQVNLEHKLKWKQEFNYYVSTSGAIENDEMYLSQEIEQDAIAFASFTIKFLLKEDLHEY